MELKRLEEKRIQEEAEQLRRKTEEQKKVFKKAYEEFERSLQDSESLQKEVETVLSDYRKAKNHFKIKVQFESNDFIATQQIENTQFSAAADRIRSSEIQLFKMEGELEKTKQIRDDYIRDLNQSWYTRLWRFLY
ncbi:hypothetical protein GCK72_000156 [Caenorhabditis remanei]|uniref:Uncharacterized protein n=2 Tax=Caenorhabditis TaxID=6237 RepID=A0A6A5HP30_CAERE|nr:hypothetical protein GCK72_000156 [Caenorhabditis remanei]KAF1768344.1 hypothetical protein GCK72_000156 [Caenorhabditis remanei]